MIVEDGKTDIVFFYVSFFIYIYMKKLYSEEVPESPFHQKTANILLIFILNDQELVSVAIYNRGKKQRQNIFKYI